MRSIKQKCNYSKLQSPTTSRLCLAQATPGVISMWFLLLYVSVWERFCKTQYSKACAKKPNTQWRRWNWPSRYCDRIKAEIWWSSSSENNLGKKVFSSEMFFYNWAYKSLTKTLQPMKSFSMSPMHSSQWLFTTFWCSFLNKYLLPKIMR